MQNNAPYFTSALPIFRVNCGEKANFTLPTIIDDEDFKLVSVILNPTSYSFITFDSVNKVVVVNPSPSYQAPVNVSMIFTISDGVNKVNYTTTL